VKQQACLFMTTKTLDQKTRKLEKEVELLRSFIIGQTGRDLEGSYRPEFVEDMLKALLDNDAEHKFTSKNSFLKYLNGKS